jgi:hypothetical protein
MNIERNPSEDETEFDDRPHGPWISFHDWYMLQDADMQARVKRVFPSLKVLLEGRGAP